MPAFGYIETESVVQQNDKLRIFVGKSFSPKGDFPIKLVRIKPEASGAFVTVGSNLIQTKDWFLDWQYETAGAKMITLEITLDDISNPPPVTFNKAITVLTAAEDMLFSSDDDLVAKESNIMNWVKPGRNSYLNFHRQAQTEILNWLDEIRIWKNDGSKLTKADLKFTDDLKQLSANWALALIFADLSNKVDDVFAAKSKSYFSAVETCKGRGRIQADFNNSGTLEKNENADMKSARLIRR